MNVALLLLVLERGRGTLTLMVGGDEATANRLWPLFTAFGESVFYMGPTGSGVVAKLINNLIALGGYALQLEGMRLGAAYGLREDAITTAVIASQGECKGIRTWGRHDRSARSARHRVWTGLNAWAGISRKPRSRPDCAVKRSRSPP